MTRSSVYLIEAQNGLVKIGRAVVVRDRVTTVRTHSPVLTRLIATWPGGEPEEAELHRRFADHRRHGEWFEVRDVLAQFIEQMRGRNVADIPAWDELLVIAREAFGARRNMLARQMKRDGEALWPPRSPGYVAEVAA